MKTQLLHILILFCSIGLQAQDIITYSTVQTAGIKEACKGFVLTPGFSFKASSGSSMNLRINSSACSPTSNTTGISASQNYIVTLTPLGQTKSITYDNGKITVDRTIEGDIDVLTQIQYFDGLGRPIQTVQKGVTPAKSDLVTYQEYDPMGRDDRSWLPLIAIGNNGAFMTLDNVRKEAAISYADSIAYSKPTYEASPLNRVLEQYGPGLAWKTANASVQIRHLTNVATGDAKRICSLFTVDGVGLATKVKRSGNYAANELYVTEMKDEMGNLTSEFKNKLGQVILIRQIETNVNHDTYYVYDDFGNQCFVLPPAVSDVLITTTGSWDSTTSTPIAQYAYIYRYDEHNRCIQKQFPGAESIFYVYDKADRLIFSQDGEQRKKGEWIFSIPDVLGRIVLSGSCKNIIDYSNKPLANEVVNAVWAKTTNINKGYDITGITLITPTVLTVNYYDSYEFMELNGIPAITDDNFKPETITGFGVHYTGGYKTLLTGNWTARLDGSSNGVYNVMYYDNKGQLIQTKSNNHLAGGIEKKYIAYNFTGQPIQKQHVHIATGKKTQTELYTYVYDHVGRLTMTKHKLNTEPNVILAQNTYDELGRLSTITPNNQANLKTTYAYNIRSWTTSITNYHFVENLNYVFNGDISTQNWLQAGTNRTYTFAYDNLSRIKTATYAGDGSFGTSYSYDKMGNIKTIVRNGLTAAATYGTADNLSFGYSGNQLQYISDAGSNVGLATSADFKDYSKVTAAEYVFNTNGAMTKDLNRGISNIQYNSLNLPVQVDLKSPVAEARNEYTYSATGAKLKVVKKWNPSYSTTPVIGTSINPALLTISETTDYVDNKIYENGELKRILTDNGYIERNIYYFYVRDHLGNNRIVANTSAEVIQCNQYYPFGMAFAEGASAEQSKQPYKYNSKEFDQSHGVNWYDYSARYFAPDVSRFTTMDPLAEKYYSVSPYAYCLNNPIRFIDPDGKKPTVKEAAYMSRHVYSGNGELIGGWRVSDQNFGVKLSNSRTGFNSAFYERTTNGVTEYSYVTAGTNITSIADWKNNLDQVLNGKSPQYEQSIKNARLISENLREAELTFTGHSLGGGLAAANALATGKDAITFNAVGLSSKTKSNNDLTEKAKIDAYIVQGEFLDQIQSPMGLKADGAIHYLPASYVGVFFFTSLDDLYRNYQRIQNHRIGAIIDINIPKIE